MVFFGSTASLVPDWPAGGGLCVVPVPEPGATWYPGIKAGLIGTTVISMGCEDAGGVYGGCSGGVLSTGVLEAVVAGGGVPGGTTGVRGPVTAIPSGTPRGPTIHVVNE